MAPGTPALAERIRDGDARAISTFRELHVRQMRAYCEVACSPQLVDEAIAAGFVDFLGRVTKSRLADSELEAALLRATRSAAAGRMPVDSEQPDCWGVPELLAARANDELPGDERTLRDHLGDCPICQETLARMDRAEQAFHPPEAQAEEPSPPDAPQVEETPSPASEPVAPPAPGPPDPAAAPPPPPAPPAPPAPAAPTPPAPPAPTPPPPAAAPPRPPAPPRPAPAAPVTVRRRTGGLIGAIAKRRRPPLS